MAPPEPVTDHYEVLGLSPDASDREVKRAYKKLALKFHPDRRPGPAAEAVLRRLNDAYAVLRDPKEREHYDWLLRQRRPPAAPPTPPTASRARRSPPGADGPSPPSSEGSPPIPERWRREGRRRRAYARTTAAKARSAGQSRVAGHAETMRDLEAAYEHERARHTPGRRRLTVLLMVLAVLIATVWWLRG